VKILDFGLAKLTRGIDDLHAVQDLANRRFRWRTRRRTHAKRERGSASNPCCIRLPGSILGPESFDCSACAMAAFKELGLLTVVLACHSVALSQSHET